MWSALDLSWTGRVIIGMDAGPGGCSCEGFGSGEHVMKRKQVLLPRTVARQIAVTLSILNRHFADFFNTIGPSRTFQRC
jgi:hypothetical protein